MEEARQMLVTAAGNSPQSRKVAREGVRFIYCLQRSVEHLHSLANEMVAIRLESRKWRIAADSVSILGNALSFFGIFVPLLWIPGIILSVPASLYRLKKDCDHRGMERKAKHEVKQR